MLIGSTTENQAIEMFSSSAGATGLRFVTMLAILSTLMPRSTECAPHLNNLNYVSIDEIQQFPLELNDYASNFIDTPMEARSADAGTGKKRAVYYIG